ncbi:hypothetical protein [Xanthomonas theicola]|uniref:Uncharacterized protein n=1 Tax=Xanthomonas theicola TaxID=56464 RepID=A0A2S6ZGG8_9XANT|nr:hypothetical protein [Xanthomonas theicola]PPT91343.1 hypothetical protein XthCFBP4691_07845 [Xanthomonas theicola]QNH24379.1 hypothetical protein G4Q83_05880 [Xanthomonas theicola]
MSDNGHTQSDHDASLLEGLYQLAVSGQARGWEFEQLSNEVYDRLKQTYEHAGVGSAQAQLRGRQAA